MRDPEVCHYCNRSAERIVQHQYASHKSTLHLFRRGACLDHEPRAREDAAWRKDLEREDLADYNGW